MRLGFTGPVTAFPREEKCSQLQEFTYETNDSATVEKEECIERPVGGVGGWNCVALVTDPNCVLPATNLTWLPTTGSSTETLIAGTLELLIEYKVESHI